MKDKIKKIILSNEHPLKIWKEIRSSDIYFKILEICPFLIGKKISQIIYHFKNNIYIGVHCKCCESPVRYVSINIGYVKYCSNKCQSKDYWDNVSEQGIKDRNINISSAFLKKYGVDNPQKLDSVKQKYRETSIIKYGVSHHLKSKISKDKVKDNLMKKYGVDNVSKLESVKESKLAKSMAKSNEEKEEILLKYKKTCLEKYGVEHRSQESDFIDEVLKKSFSYKSYRLPSGKIISLQGYEPYIMDHLFNKYSEDEILYKNIDIEKQIGKIFYLNDNGRKSRYYPDIFIIPDNKIIEVKSYFTYDLDFDKNIKKKNECLRNNINFEFYIYDNKNKSIEVI